jgi:hypothetical protein
MVPHLPQRLRERTKGRRLKVNVAKTTISHLHKIHTALLSISVKSYFYLIKYRLNQYSLALAFIGSC